jgi:hypothetical protein
MKRGIIDALYWRLHSSFLKNDRKRADFMLGMLEDEGLRSSIEEELGPIHYKRYVAIRHKIWIGQYGRLYDDGYSTPLLEQTFAPEETTIGEAEFHKKLMSKEGRSYLSPLIGVSSNASWLHELNMNPYGRCDFVVREGRKQIAIEVKINEAKSAVVGQIDKYRLNLELEMANGLCDYVEAIVIAKTFSPYVSAELSRLGVRMICHDGEIAGLRLI